MIGYLSGEVIDISGQIIILDVNHIGYEINTNSISINIGDKLDFFIRTIIRDNDISLFGFKTKEEKQLFDKLITVDGIGPKMALNIICNIKPDDLIKSIIDNDVDKITKIKGIGKKGASKIIFSLHDKFEKEKKESVLKSFSQKQNDVVQSLIFLGYNQEQSNAIVDKIFDESKDIGELVKIALIELKK